MLSRVACWTAPLSPAVEVVVFGFAVRSVRRRRRARRPGRSAGLVLDRPNIVAEAGEKALPTGVDRRRIAQVAGVKLLYESAVCAVQK